MKNGNEIGQWEAYKYYRGDFIECCLLAVVFSILFILLIILSYRDLGTPGDDSFMVWFLFWGSIISLCFFIPFYSYNIYKSYNIMRYTKEMVMYRFFKKDEEVSSLLEAFFREKLIDFDRKEIKKEISKILIGYFSYFYILEKSRLTIHILRSFKSNNGIITFLLMGPATEKNLNERDTIISILS